MESAEKTLSEMVSATDFDTTRFFVEEDKSAQRDPEAIVQEMKAKRQEIEDFYTKVCCLIFSDFFSHFFWFSPKFFFSTFFKFFSTIYLTFFNFLTTFYFVNLDFFFAIQSFFH